MKTPQSIHMQDQLKNSVHDIMAHNKSPAAPMRMMDVSVWCGLLAVLALLSNNA